MWRELFDDRQRKEIHFNRIYLNDFNHGTSDHNLRIIVAKMAVLLDGLCEDSSVRKHIERLAIQKRIENDEK